MFSPSELSFSFGAVVAFSLASAGADLWRGRIYNWLTLPMLVGGLVFSLIQGGWGALGQSALAVALALVLYGWMFWLGVMGGGDIKFLMAVGAWGGPAYALEVALLALFAGGAMAALLLLFRGTLGAFAGKLYRFLQSIFLKELVVAFPKLDRSHTMPYGIPLAVAAIWSAYSHPIARVFLSQFAAFGEGGRTWF